MQNYLNFICTIIIAGTFIIFTMSIVKYQLMTDACKKIMKICDGMLNKPTPPPDLKNAMKLDDLLAIVNKVISFNITHEISLGSYESLSAQELSVVFDDIQHDLSVKTYTQLSDQIKKQILLYVSDDFLTNYIVDYIRATFIASVESRRKPTMTQKINASGRQSH